MSFSLYRKYRPETFADVVGQEHVETTLRNAVLSGKVSHAYLFTGPRGTGKTTTARLLAKALLCEQAPTDHPDGSCEQCREIAEGIHPDVFELDAASRTGVENVREEIIGRVQYAPTRGSYKIYIIDEVHMLSMGAFNALLKTLEEPPSHVVFILCTTEANKVPETIRARCQGFDFHLLSDSEIRGRLRSIAEQEGFAAEAEALDLIARRSRGGMRDAIGSLEQVAVFGDGEVSFEAARSMLGEVVTSELFSIADLIAARDIAGCFAWVATFTQGGTDIAQMTRDLTVHVRNLYVTLVAGEGAGVVELLGGEGADVVAYQAQAARFGSADRLANALAVLGELSGQLRTATNARLALEIALARLTRPASDLTLESLADRIAVLEQGGGAATGGRSTESSQAFGAAASQEALRDAAQEAAQEAAQPRAAAPMTPTGFTPPAPSSPDTSPPASGSPAPAPATTVDFGALSSANVGRLWSEVANRLSQMKKRRLAALLGGSQAALDASGEGVTVELPHDAAFAKDTFEEPENKTLFTRLLAEVAGTHLALNFTLAAGGASSSQPTPASPSSALDSPSPTASTNAQTHASSPILTPESAPPPAPAAASTTPTTPTTSSAPAANPVSAEPISEPDSILFETFGITFEES